MMKTLYALIVIRYDIGEIHLTPFPFNFEYIINTTLRARLFATHFVESEKEPKIIYLKVIQLSFKLTIIVVVE